MAVAESTSALAGVGVVLASMGRSVRDVLDYEPMTWMDSTEQSRLAHKLKDRYGKRGAMPKVWADVPVNFLDSLPAEVRRQCEEHVRLGDEVAAIRRAYCRKLAHLYACSECGRMGKKPLDCKRRTCLVCAKKNFDALFKKFLQVDSMIPAVVRSQSGYTWHVLDFSFRHDGDMPKQWELRAMVRVIRRTVQRAVREECPDLYNARWESREDGLPDFSRPCPLRKNGDGTPMSSADGWPVVGLRDGSVRELVGWHPIFFAEHDAPDNEARKHGEKGAKKKIPARYELRFGYELIRVTEFGFDNVNAHFHGAFFGPALDYWYDKRALKAGRLVCGGRLVDIFKEESSAGCYCKFPAKVEKGERWWGDYCKFPPEVLGGLGMESYTVFFEPAKQGFHSVLAHALKYTEKIPASTPEGLAQLEHVLRGTRLVALLGLHYGVPLEREKPCNPKCFACGSVMERIKDLGVVLVSEVADLPEVVEPGGEESLREPGADEFLVEEGRGP